MAFPKKIPTLAALFILFFIIGALSFFVQKFTAKKLTSFPNIEPSNLMVTTVSDTGAKIIWQTKEPTTGFVTLNAKNGVKISSYDERDVTGKRGKYTTHSVPVKNLQPNTTYDIEVISGGKQFPIKNTTDYTLRTGPAIASATSGLEPSYGMVKTNEGKPASGGLLVVALENSQPVSTLITDSGSWIIPLNAIRTKDLSAYLPSNTKVNETITVYYGNEKTEGITDTENDAPVPDMTVGTSTDFRNLEAKGKSSSSLTFTNQKKSVLGEQTTVHIGGVAITQPVQNSSIVSHRPVIQGRGIPGKTVTLTIGISKPETGKTTVGANGLWSFTPTKSLAVGKQSATMTTLDEKGKPVALTTVFTILKAGSQVLGEATPSATLEITATATPTEIPSTISAEPMPEPGGSLPTILLIIMGVGMVAGGVIFLL